MLDVRLRYAKNGATLPGGGARAVFTGFRAGRWRKGGTSCSVSRRPRSAGDRMLRFIGANAARRSLPFHNERRRGTLRDPLLRRRVRGDAQLELLSGENGEREMFSIDDFPIKC